MEGVEFKHVMMPRRGPGGKPSLGSLDSRAANPYCCLRMEYGLFLASAAVSALVNAAGRFRRTRPRRFLVVKLDHLGDLVTATPVFRALRDAHPDAVIDALVGPWAARLLERSPHLSRVLTYDARRFRRMRGAGGTVGARAVAGGERPAPPLARMRVVARGGYTDIVELRGDAWTLLLPFLCGARQRSDRGSARIALWLRRHGLLPGGSNLPLHEVATNLATARPFLAPGVVPDEAMAVEVAAAEREALRRRLADAGIDLARPTVCIHAGALWRPRAWWLERWASLAAHLEERHHVQTVFVGSAAERDLEAELRAVASGPGRHFLFGTLSLRETCVLLGEARLVIGNDSGLIHIAAACGTPVVGLYGPQLPERFGPRAPRSIALHHRIDCCPCAQRTCVRPEEPCVNLITVEEVLAAAERLLAPGAQAAREAT